MPAAPSSPSRSLASRAALIVVGACTLALLYALAVSVLGRSLGLDAPRQTRGTTTDIVQVEVLNGAGVPGLAHQATLYLRDRGFDVVNVGNAAPTTTSRVLDRVGDPASALRVAHALGLSDDDIRADSGAYYLDCTIIIGRDYARLSPYETDDP